jgi:GNAT superfamily N-acetyltransferase
VAERSTADLIVRGAHADEGPRLKEIAIDAKCHWGYERERVRRWADDGDFTPDGLAKLTTFVAEADGRAVGWVSLLRKDARWWLEDLWVEPAAMGRGVGAALFGAAAAYARSRGARELEWEAEPNAVGFYERMGGRYLRDGTPSAWGRINPIMGIDLGD